MKNQRIIDAWNKIAPSDAANRQLQNSLLTRNQAVRKSAKKTLWQRRLAPIASLALCLAAVAALALVFANSGGEQVYTAQLRGGTLRFFRSAQSSQQTFDFGVDVLMRDLTAQETGLLFGDLDIQAEGYFSAVDGSAMHIEGRGGNIKILFGLQGNALTDTVIETERTSSQINGVSVAAGYFITNKNSRGERNIIYIASFDRGDASIYVECGGSLQESATLRMEIGKVVEALTSSEAPSIADMEYLLPGLYRSGTNLLESASVNLQSDHTFVLFGPAVISYAPHGSYALENGKLILRSGGGELYLFTPDADTLIFESGAWLENWIESGSVFTLTETEAADTK